MAKSEKTVVINKYINITKKNSFFDSGSNESDFIKKKANKITVNNPNIPKSL